jgi:hypothetical protein
VNAAAKKRSRTRGGADGASGTSSWVAVITSVRDGAVTVLVRGAFPVSPSLER